MPSWRRTENPQLSANFTGRDFSCKCGLCSVQLIDQFFLTKLQELRDLYGHPIVVTSGYRCARHQETLRRNGLETAVRQSSHELGIAADIAGVGQFDMAELRRCAEEVFKDFSIGYANRFLHVDTRPAKKPARRWTYK